jgi:hypothetical protein
MTVGDEFEFCFCSNSQACMNILSEHLILWDVNGIPYSEGERYWRGLDLGRRGMPLISVMLELVLNVSVMCDSVVM